MYTRFDVENNLCMVGFNQDSLRLVIHALKRCAKAVNPLGESAIEYSKKLDMIADMLEMQLKVFHGGN